jgi:putative transposase
VRVDLSTVTAIAPQLALERAVDFRAFLGEEFDEAFAYAALRKPETTGRPIVSPKWLEQMTERTGKALPTVKRGPKPISNSGCRCVSP